MSKVSWIQNGNDFTRVEGEVSNVEQIPVGIYNVNYSMLTGWHLIRTGDKFTFDYKVYGLQDKLIKHILKTYQNTTSNLGILFNGTKGTGKTVSAKMLANMLNLPIIIVQSFGENNSSLIEYLATFNFDCVLFIDEFEKTWREKDSSILQIMDGVYTSQYRRVFLLTTNSMSINDNLISRPSRIRYIKEFGNLSKEVVEEYLKDNLKVEACKDCIIDFVDTLQISTIDILKTIVEDINIHGFETFIANKSIFNIKTAYYHYRTKFTSFESEAELKQYHYDDTKFLDDIKKHSLYLQSPRRDEYEDLDSFKEAVKKYQEQCPSRSLHTSTLTLEKPYTSLKIGETLFEDDPNEKVIKINPEKHIIITYDDSFFRYYYISNPEVKPSLYAIDDHLTNPYYNL